MARRQFKQQQRRPLIVICSEGETKSSEYYYFRNYRTRDLRIQFSTGNSTDPKGMLDDLLKYIQKEDIKSEDHVKIFLVLDTDLDDRRIEKIKEIEETCIENNIEIITSAPTFEIWLLLHYRSNKLRFNNSQDVKKEIERINGRYSETMNMYNIIKSNTDQARKIAKSLEENAISNHEELISANPHTSIYKVLDTIDEFCQKK